jgi:hypothetical protein
MNATKSREVIWGGRVKAAKANAEQARQRAVEAAREAPVRQSECIQAWARLGGIGRGGVPAGRAD